MLGHDADARAAFDDGDYPGAEGEFAANSTLNVLQTWIAPFGEGTSLLAAEEYDDALGRLEAALDHVPGDQRCTVLINVALAHEGRGDAAQTEQDAATAAEEWQAGVDALGSADCPTDSGQGEEQSATAAAVEARLLEKLEVEDPEEQPPPPSEEQQPPPPPDEEKEEELDERNGQGQQERRDREDELGFSGSEEGGPQW